MWCKKKFPPDAPIHPSDRLRRRDRLVRKGCQAHPHAAAAFAKVLLDTFEFRNTVQAETVGREVSPSLALTRMGPYRVLAKKKGEAEYSMVIQINTTAHFLDSSGKETKVLAKAVSLHEDFDSIEIDPLPETAKPAPAAP
jgi:hypothetical protein